MSVDRGTLSSSLSSSSNAGIDTPSEVSLFSQMLIAKPPPLADKCPIDSESPKRFPVIKNQPRTRIRKKEEPFPSDSLEFWLKPGISLPKLHSKIVPEARVETIEPFPILQYSKLSTVKKYESLSEKSFYDYKCSETESENLEVPNDVFGPSKCERTFRVPSEEFDFSKLLIKEEPLEESHALKNWRKWNTIHKKQEKYLVKKLNKKPDQLLLEKSELYRQCLEQKMLLGMWEVPKADKWRGHPSEWSAPTSKKGKKHVKNIGSTTEYVLEKTATQKGKVPEIEFITTPNIVKQEKYLETYLSQTHLLIKPSKRYRFLSQRIDGRIRSFLKSKNRIRPSVDSLSNLAVSGVQILPPTEEEVHESVVASNLPVIKVTAPNNKTGCVNFRNSVFCLVINGTEINYEYDSVSQNEEARNYDYVWEFHYGVNMVGKRVDKLLQIENRGTVAVRYEWISKKLERTENAYKLSPKQHEPWFYFNKNSGIFLPGQFYEFRFYNKAEKPGARTETWYLKTTPPLGKNVEFATIILSGVVSEVWPDPKLHMLEDYFMERLKDSIMKFIFNVLLQRVMNTTEFVRHLEYRGLFSDKQLFEYHNPNYYFHSALVEELNVLFENVIERCSVIEHRFEGSGRIPFKSQTTWDLSLKSLTKLASTGTKGRERELLFCEINNIAKKLLKPSYVFSSNDKKYRMVYNILCKMANFMEEDQNYLLEILCKNKRQNKNLWEYGEYEEELFSAKSDSELDSFYMRSFCELRPMNLLYYQTMFYMKVYYRVVEAVENIVDVIETNKWFEPSGITDYREGIPWRKEAKFNSPHCPEGFTITLS